MGEGSWPVSNVFRTSSLWHTKRSIRSTKNCLSCWDLGNTATLTYLPDPNVRPFSASLRRPNVWMWHEERPRLYWRSSSSSRRWNPACPGQFELQWGWALLRSTMTPLTSMPDAFFWWRYVGLGEFMVMSESLNARIGRSLMVRACIS